MIQTEVHIDIRANQNVLWRGEDTQGSGVKVLRIRRLGLLLRRQNHDGILLVTFL